MRTVVEKLGLKPSMKAYLLNAPADFQKQVETSVETVSTRLVGEFDYIHFFANSQSHLKKEIPRLKKHLTPKGTLWISWKKNRKDNSDLTIKNVIEIGYDFGMVESKAISIDDDWSALKFTFPIEGKVYNNSYGKLKKE